MIIELGKINLGPIVFVADPSYSVNIWCAHTIENMLPGEYHCIANQVNKGDLGERIASLSIVHKDYVNKNLNFKCINAQIGVDSGCAGFWDYIEYIKIKRGTEEREKFFDAYYNAIINKKGDTIRGWGVVSRSGYGDGDYTLKIAHDEEHRNVVAATIDYILEE